MLIILLSKKIEFIGELTIEKEIVFVTHNTGKIKSAEKYFKNLKFTTFNYELNEPISLWLSVDILTYL